MSQKNGQNRKISVIHMYRVSPIQCLLLISCQKSIALSFIYYIISISEADYYNFHQMHGLGMINDEHFMNKFYFCNKNLVYEKEKTVKR